MVMSKRTLLLLYGSLIAVTVLVGGSFLYRAKASATSREDEWRERCRAQWLQVVANRNGKKEIVHGVPVDGHMLDLKTLHDCFKPGEPASNCAAILVTGTRVEADPMSGVVEYRWTFNNGGVKHFRFTVYVSGEPPVIQSYYGADSGN